VLATSLIILVIGQKPSDPSTLAFERALHGVLGNATTIEVQAVAEDPPDETSVAQAAGSDGLVELIWAGDGRKARVHCYVVREGRWVDREISFGAATASPEREAAERGRLLGFAVGTMFAEEAALEAPTASDVQKPPTPSTAPSALKAPEASEPPIAPGAPQHDAASSALDRSVPVAESGRRLEFAGVASVAIRGEASGLGASAGVRLAWTGPIWARLFAAARGGNIELAETTTGTGLIGAGLALAAFRPAERFQLGLRIDAFASYFRASHLSEDDITPAHRSRWLPGGDLVAEAGIHLLGKTGLFLGGGLEAVVGRTDIYTHGNKVAVVPALRAVGEFGFRTPF
jgi:hypothetical protein